MAIIAGFAVLVAIGWATTHAVDAAWQAIRSQYQARNGRFRAQHPTSNRAAAAGASLAATLRHGTGPALQAFRDDWNKHFALRKDAVQAKYAQRSTWAGFEPPEPDPDPEPVGPELAEPPAPTSPTQTAPEQSNGWFDDDPDYQRLKAIRDSGYTGWLDKDLRKVDKDGRPLDEKPAPLRLVPNTGTSEEGVQMGYGESPDGKSYVRGFKNHDENDAFKKREPASFGTPIAHGVSFRPFHFEVHRIADIRNGLAVSHKHMQLELDDAVAGLQRAKGTHQALVNFAEQAKAILDRDPELASLIYSLIEPARARVDAAQMDAQAADAALAASQAALNGLGRHRGVEEAVQATPQASTNTAVYQGN